MHGIRISKERVECIDGTVEEDRVVITLDSTGARFQTFDKTMERGLGRLLRCDAESRARRLASYHLVKRHLLHRRRTAINGYRIIERWTDVYARGFSSRVRQINDYNYVDKRLIKMFRL